MRAAARAFGAAGAYAAPAARAACTALGAAVRPNVLGGFARAANTLCPSAWPWHALAVLWPVAGKHGRVPCAPPHPPGSMHALSQRFFAAAPNSCSSRSMPCRARRPSALPATMGRAAAVSWSRTTPPGAARSSATAYRACRSPAFGCAGRPCRAPWPYHAWPASGTPKCEMMQSHANFSASPRERRGLCNFGELY
jgi:hypothetical protein